MHLTASGTRIFESAQCLTGRGFERIHDEFGVARRATPNRGDRTFEGSRQVEPALWVLGGQPPPATRSPT